MDITKIIKLHDTTINVKINKNNFIQGEKVFGLIECKFDKRKKIINGISLNLYIDYLSDDGKTNRLILDEYKISNKFQTYQYEEKLIPFEFILPRNTPITSAFTLVFIELKIDINLSLPIYDIKKIRVNPSKEIEIVSQLLINKLQFTPSYRMGTINNGKQLFEFYCNYPAFRLIGLQDVVIEFTHSDCFLFMNIYFKIHNEYYNSKISLYCGHLYYMNFDINTLYEELYNSFVFELNKFIKK